MNQTIKRPIVRNFYYSKRHEGHRAVISHEKSGFDIIQSVVRRHKPEIMIELGTFYFGTTLLLHEALPDVTLFSFDKFDGRTYLGKCGLRMTTEKIVDLVDVCFNGNVYFNLDCDVLVKNGNPEIVSLCKMPNRKLLYCDNGNKVRELQLYAHLLNRRDLLGVHDWGFEIDFTFDTVRESLADFIPHPINDILKEVGSTTRFFIKVI